MGKTFLIWGLKWLVKKFSSMKPEEIHALFDKRLDVLLKLKEGSPKEEKLDIIMINIIQTIQVVVKDL